MELSDDRCIAAIYDGSLCSIASSNSKEQRACARIHSLVSQAAEELRSILAAANIDSRRFGVPRHYNQFGLEVDSNNVRKAMEILRERGYEQWAPLHGGALRCYLEHYRSMLFIRDGETTMRVQLRWGKSRHVPRLFSPTIKSLSFIQLPGFAWPAYYLLRPLQLAISLLRGERYIPELRPFLGTPGSLLLPLFELARLKPDDVFVDVGCGDGRVAIEATRRYGCRSIGIEYHSAIADRARTLVQQSDLENGVTILQGDAMSFNLDTATVVFVFLPMSIWQTLLPKILKKLNPGTVVIAHELHSLDTSFAPQPEQSVPVIGEDAITVAHVWIA